MGVAAIGGDQFGVQPQSLKVFLHPYQAFGFQVHRHHARECRLDFENVAGLAARCAAGIEHSLAWCQVQQVSGQLCGLVLHADPAFGKAG
ncbi:hypothetical protein D3C80_1704420 [compost metagenome]